MNLDYLAKDTLEGKRSFQKFVEHTLEDVRKQDPSIRSFHEGLAIMLEKFEEFKHEVFKKNVDKVEMLKQLASVAACCQRLSEDMLKTRIF